MASTNKRDKNRSTPSGHLRRTFFSLSNASLKHCLFLFFATRKWVLKIREKKVENNQHLVFMSKKVPYSKLFPILSSAIPLS